MGEWMMASKDIMAQCPQTVNVTLYGKRDFAEVVKDIEAGTLS